MKDILVCRVITSCRPISGGQSRVSIKGQQQAHWQQDVDRDLRSMLIRGEAAIERCAYANAESQHPLDITRGCWSH